MGYLQRKLIITVMLACGILAYGFYNFVQKTSEDRTFGIVAAPPPGNSANGVSANGVSSDIVVYISGGVSKPGVYKLTNGSRVVDVVTAAGGFLPGADVTKINLAMLLKDEMHIHVPYTVIPISTSPAIASGTANNSNTGDKVNINTATKDELDKLPGIGPALAERIIEYRTANEPFRDIADIKKVPGIGESKYNQFKNRITL